MTAFPTAPQQRPARHVWRSLVMSPDGPASTARFVAVAFAEYVDQHTGIAYPSSETLAERTGLSSRSVRTHLDTLVTSGWLVLEQQGGVPGGPRTSRYSITVPPRVVVPPVPSRPTARPAELHLPVHKHEELSAGAGDCITISLTDITLPLDRAITILQTINSAVIDE